MSMALTRFGANDPSMPVALPSLPSALSRRRAIFGAMALGTASAVAVPVACAAFEADALGAEFDRLSARFTAARVAMREAEARFVAPPIPERLFVQDGDTRHFPYTTLSRAPGSKRLWWGAARDLDKLKARKLVFVLGEPDTAAQGRRAEVLALAEQLFAATAAAEKACGMTAAEEAWDAVAEPYFAFVERLVALRTADPAVMRLKARVVAAELARHKGLDAYLADEIEANPGEVETLGLSLVRDMVAAFGLAA